MNSFIDAGGRLSAASKTDQYHRIGKAHYAALIEVKATLSTPDFVLDEVLTRIRHDFGHAKAVGFLDHIRQAERTGAPIIRRIDEDLWMKAEAIFRRSNDVTPSFTDSTSFALLREWPVDEVFGYDSHFEMTGFVLQPR